MPRRETTTSFKPGKSGNPNGRKLGSRNFHTMSLLAAEGTLTPERIKADLLELEAKDRVNATIKFSELSFRIEQHADSKESKEVDLEGDTPVDGIIKFGNGDDDEKAP